MSIQLSIKKLSDLLLTNYRNKKESIDSIDDEVLNKYKEFLELSGIDFDKLRSINRKDNLQNVRKIIIMELHYLGYKQTEIAEFLRKDRTSILYHINNFEPKYNHNLKKSLELFIKLYPKSKLAKLY